MADGVSITSGAGTTISTDDVSGVGHVQFVKLMDGTLDSSAKIAGDATNGLDVDVTRVGGTVTVGGVAANGASISGNPVLNGAEASTSLVADTAVTDGQAVNMKATADGRLLTTPYGSPENYVSGAITMATDTSTQVIAAGATGVRTYITSITVFNSSATGAAVQIKDGTTVMVEGYMPAGGGFHMTFPVPLRGSAATAWNCDTAGAVTTTYVTMVGYQSKV